ncbi:carboxypeptidase-like regulatory domain-containing protein [Marinifilum caeruleilacunae]|uniref:carboxypeptidase-like regulatory domain-containing protein n=1 Tax=Marinifilum caeruleilacunae TaxID=2499076 RepID=UPI0014909A7B|nr:carboxypeptidase-like regulatory domain-containing protein [Marinifilum caeruleilacunae]
MKTTISTIILLILLINTALSQNKQDQTFIVSGKVINSETKEGVSYAHVNLDDTYWGIICDSLGFFRIRVNPDQKLKVTAMGFKAQVVDIQTPSVENEIFQEVYMDKESFMLREVKVYSFGSWNEFKEQFVKSKAPEDPDASLAMSFGDFTKDEYTGRALRRQGAGVSFGFGNGKKKYKGMKVPTRLEEIHAGLLAEKYNRNIVADITKEHGKRLDILMKYINSRSSFTHQTSDLYIVRKIKQLHKEFLKENPDWDYNFSYADSLGKIQNHLRP